MLRTPMILGISMATRKNRRLFVVVTYVILLVLMATIIIIRPRGNQVLTAMICIILVSGVVSGGVFGKLVKQTVPPEIRFGEMTSLGLARKRRDADEPDEREVAIRNAAHFRAFRALAMYSIFYWVLIPSFSSTIPSFFSLNSLAAVKALQLLTLPLLAMAVTLPQAIILWTEPDVPEEARV